MACFFPLEKNIPVSVCIFKMKTEYNDENTTPCLVISFCVGWCCSFAAKPYLRLRMTRQHDWSCPRHLGEAFHRDMGRACIGKKSVTDAIWQFTHGIALLFSVCLSPWITPFICLRCQGWLPQKWEAQVNHLSCPKPEAFWFSSSNPGWISLQKMWIPSFEQSKKEAWALRHLVERNKNFTAEEFWMLVFKE